MAENAEQKRLFTAALQKQCGDEDKERSQFLTERKYEEVCAVLEEFSGARDASEKKAVQKVHSQVYAWAKKYELVTFKGSNILIFKGGADGDSETLALDQAQVVSHHGRVFGPAQDPHRWRPLQGQDLPGTHQNRSRQEHPSLGGRGLCQLLPLVRAETAQEAQLGRAQAHPNQGPR